VEPAVAPGGPQVRTLHWSSAGHPPPVHIAPDGRAMLLETKPDLLLGLAAADRSDHPLQLEPGAILVLYTDGLVERDTPLDDRLLALAAQLEGRQGMSAEGVCDLLIGRLEEDVDDDVALLVLKAGR
jgi:serine phosphatase RsbU (regulator of sigma subunit)